MYSTAETAGKCLFLHILERQNREVDVLLCLHFHKAALGSSAERGKKALRRRLFDSYRVPVDLGFAVNNSLFSTYQAV